MAGWGEGKAEGVRVSFLGLEGERLRSPRLKSLHVFGRVLDVVVDDDGLDVIVRVGARVGCAGFYMC